MLSKDLVRKQNLRTLDDGSTEVVCADDWLSPINKHLAFGDIGDAELKKRMLDALINELLASNASLAARGKPPMEFDKIH